jgi:signal transduction histidine kinase
MLKNDSERSQALPSLILIVDDDPVIRDLLYQFLTQQGHQVIEANDGVQAIEVFQRNTPDLIVLDAQMPELNGFDCCQIVRRISQNPFLPILMLSGLEDADSVKQAFAAGVTDYMTKPFNWAILLQRIQQLLQTKQTMALMQEHTAKLQSQIQELKLLLQIKNNFFNTVSHDLQSILSNIQMSILMLEKTLTETTENSEQLANWQKYPKGQTYLQISRDECKRGIDLINNSLNLQRIEANENPQLSDLILLKDWLFHISASFAERAQQRQQILQIQIETDLLAFTTNSASLTRVLSELLNNACKYTPPGGTITMRVYATSDKLYLRVSNSGVEVSTIEAERIFDEFYQIPGSDRWQQGGTGLGLAIVKQLVRQLNGLVEVESESGWIHFTIELPL